MKRFGIFLFCALAALGVFAADKWIVGFENDHFPDSYLDGKNIRGVDVEIAREIARRQKVEFFPVLLLKRQLLEALDSKQIDCIGNGVALSEKTQKYAVIASGESHFVAVVLASSPIKRAVGLTENVSAVETGTPAHRAVIERFGDRTLTRLFPTGSREESLMRLQAGGVAAVILDFDEAQKLLVDYPGKYRIIDEKIFFEEYGILFRTQDAAMRDQVLEHLEAMANDGTLDAITKKYAAMPRPANDASGVLPHRTAPKIDYLALLGQLWSGLLVTIEIFFLTLIFSLPLGQVIALCRMAKNPVLSWVSRIYISIMRGTPLMLQLLVWYFGPYYLFQVNLSELSFCGIEYRFTAVIIGFALNYAAYFAEIYRAGIESIPRGQYEAASVLGFTKSQTFFKIILPQVIKRVVPPVTNEVITLVKDTSLAFSLSVLEMFTIAKQVASAHATMMPFVVAGIFYYIFNFVVAYAMERLEKSLNYYH